jgi:hypothetical protein
MGLESGRKQEIAKPPIKVENEVILDKPELPAVYKLIYAHHDRQNNPADLKFNNGQKPDCIVLERGGIKTDEESIKGEMAAQYKMGGQYKNMIIYAAENSVPLYLIDYDKDIEDEMHEGKYNSVVSDVLSTGGLLFLTDSIIKNDIASIRKQGLNRRNFLKLFGKASAAAYLSAPAIDMTTFVTDETDEHSAVREIRKKNRTIISQAQPWTKSALVQGRNIIFAMLLEKLSKQLQGSLHRKPNVPFVVGSDHFEIESEIGKDSEDLKKSLSKYIEKMEDLESPGSIIKVEFTKNDSGKYNIKITPQ